MGNRESQNTSELPSIAVDMPSRRNGRRFAIVSTVLSQMGLPHWAFFPLLRRIGLKGIEQRAVNSGLCSLAFDRRKTFDLLVTDHESGIRSRKVLKVDYDFMKHLRGEETAQTLFLPILFHPDMLNTEAYEKASGLAVKDKRPIGALFAGNCDQATYDNPEIEAQYGLLNRYSIMQLASKLPAGQVVFPLDRRSFDEALIAGKLADKLVWIDTNRFRIAQNEWLDIIGKSRHFVCTPGVRYPYCQNLNEAMACGSVPILQYPDFYQPSLRDGANALVFSNGVDFAKTIGRALETNPADWGQISRSAVEYHDSRLGLLRVNAAISDFLADESRERMTWVMAGKP